MSNIAGLNRVKRYCPSEANGHGTHCKPKSGTVAHILLLKEIKHMHSQVSCPLFSGSVWGIFEAGMYVILDISV